MGFHRRAAHLLLFLVPVLGALLPSSGEASGGTVPGLPCPAPSLVRNIAPGTSDANPGELVDVAGTLYFVVNNGDHDELWKSDGTEAGTVRLPSPPQWTTGTALRDLTAAGGTLFFMVSLPNQNTELWRSSAAPPGIALVRAFPPQNRVDHPEFVAIGTKLFFVVDTPGLGIELWWSDGIQTAVVKDLHPSGDSLPAELTPLNGELFFSATTPSTGSELWKVNAMGVVEPVGNIGGNVGSSPDNLTVMGGWLYFFAVDDFTDAKLWKTNGTTVTRSIPSSIPPFHAQFSNLTATGNRLFFLFDDGIHGQELWTSDGENGASLVKDIAPNIGTASPEQLIGVGDTLFFTAANENGERELWRSDGTAAGTWRVRDFTPGNASTPVLTLAPGPGVLLAAVDDKIWGSELWKIDVTGTYRLTDISPGSGESGPSEMTISGGKLYFVAEHPQWGNELFSLPLDQVDCYAPRLFCPGNQRLEATHVVNGGSVAAFTPPPAVVFEDSIVGASVSYLPPPPTHFPLGSTRITVVANDAAGNSSQCSYEVTVQDSFPPLLLCPQEVRQEATSAAGAAVYYFVGERDAVRVNYSHPSGSHFPMGESAVTVEAFDAANNRSTCTFPVYVSDTVPPHLSCPGDEVRLATSVDPIPITYEFSRPDDATELSISHPSGSLFPVGLTDVTIEARDAAGNLAQCVFQVNHFDPVSPTITCPGPQQAVASEEEGARVDFPAAVAEDNLAPPTVSYSQEPGSTFAVGETAVTATARDLWGNTASCTFTVTVVKGDSGCGCQTGMPAGSLWWLLLALAPVWARRRAASR